MIRRGGVGANRREGVRVANATLWNPKAPGGLTGWISDASFSGSPVATVTNLGSAGGSWTAAGAAQPTTTAIGARTALLFDGTNNIMTGGPSPNALGVTGGNYTVIAALRPDALAGVPAFGYAGASIIQDATSGDMYPIEFRATGVYAGHFTAGSLDKFTATIGVSTSTVYIVQVWYDGTNINLTANGSTQTVATGPSPMAGSANATTIGANYTGTPKFQGAIGELLIYSSDIGAGARSSAVGYLKSRFPTAV